MFSSTYNHVLSISRSVVCSLFIHIRPPTSRLTSRTESRSSCDVLMQEWVGLPRRGHSEEGEGEGVVVTASAHHDSMVAVDC